MTKRPTTVTVTRYRNGRAVSTRTLTVAQFRRAHPASDSVFNGRVGGRGRPKAEVNALSEIREDEQLDVPLAPALARLLGGQ